MASLRGVVKCDLSTEVGGCGRRLCCVNVGLVRVVIVSGSTAVIAVVVVVVVVVVGRLDVIKRG